MQFWEKKATATQVLRNWIVSYTGNFIGALFIVKLVALTGLAVAGPSAVTISSIKTGLTFSQALSRGILGNWLVIHPAFYGHPDLLVQTLFRGVAIDLHHPNERAVADSHNELVPFRFGMCFRRVEIGKVLHTIKRKLGSPGDKPGALQKADKGVQILFLSGGGG